MATLLSRILLLGAFATALAVIRPCPDVVFGPPPGTDIGLCADTCFLQCYYAPEAHSVCSNGPASYAAQTIAQDAEITKFEVLSDKTCTLYVDEGCDGQTVAYVQGPGSVGIDTTAVGSVICE